MRVLKGYSKEEQRDLKNIKQLMSWNDLLNTLTSFQPSNTKYGLIEDKFDKAKTDERISIIRDILDFYTDKAKFPEKKYVVHDKVTNQYICFDKLKGSLYWSQLRIPDEKTKDEWLGINPSYEPMLEKVEE